MNFSAVIGNGRDKDSSDRFTIIVSSQPLYHVAAIIELERYGSAGIVDNRKLEVVHMYLIATPDTGQNPEGLVVASIDHAP